MLTAVITKEEYAAAGDAVKEHYKEDNGRYILEIDLTEHPMAQSLMAKVEEERAGNRKATEALDAALKKFKNQDQQLKGDLTSQINTLKDEYEEKVAKALRERDQWKTHAERSSITEGGARAIAAAKGIPALLLPHIQQQAYVDDKGRVLIKGKDGKPLLRKGYVNFEDYMSLDEYVGTLRDSPDFSVAFESKGSSGTGAAPASRNSKTAVPKFQDLTDGGRILVR